MNQLIIWDRVAIAVSPLVWDHITLTQVHMPTLTTVITTMVITSMIQRHMATPTTPMTTDTTTTIATRLEITTKVRIAIIHITIQLLHLIKLLHGAMTSAMRHTDVRAPNPKIATIA